MEDSIVARFWSRVDPGHPDSCWVFRKVSGEPCVEHTAIFSGDGPTRSKVFAHRLSYLIHNGEIPNGLYVRHTCDNPPCVNPAHLVLGTHLDNMRDKVERGLSHKGTQVKSSALTEAQVVEMRELYASGTTSMARLAKQFNVVVATVFCIVHRKTWRHL